MVGRLIPILQLAGWIMTIVVVWLAAGVLTVLLFLRRHDDDEPSDEQFDDEHDDDDQKIKNHETSRLLRQLLFDGARGQRTRG